MKDTRDRRTCPYHTMITRRICTDVFTQWDRERENFYSYGSFWSFSSFKTFGDSL